MFWFRKNKVAVPVVVDVSTIIDPVPANLDAQKARKVKQYLLLGNIAEASKRAEYFTRKGIACVSIEECDAIISRCS